MKETLITILTGEFLIGFISTMIHNETSNNKVSDITGAISILSALSMIITGLIGVFI